MAIIDQNYRDGDFRYRLYEEIPVRQQFASDRINRGTMRVKRSRNREVGLLFFSGEQAMEYSLDWQGAMQLLAFLKEATGA